MLEDSLVCVACYKTYPFCSSPLLSLFFFFTGWWCTEVDSHLYVQLYVYRSRHLHAVLNIACMFGENCFFLCLAGFETDDDDAW